MGQTFTFRAYSYDDNGEHFVRVEVGSERVPLPDDADVLEALEAWAKSQNADSADAVDDNDVGVGRVVFRFEGEWERIAPDAPSWMVERLEKLERELQLQRRRRLRRGTATLGAMFTGKDKTEKMRRSLQSLGVLSPEKKDALSLFRYEPLGWAERLVIYGLANLAREQGKLESEPWAKTGKPVASHPRRRVKLEFPGLSELARTIGYEENDNGKIPHAVRDTVQRALTSLCTVPRWIAVPVVVPPDPKKKGGTWRKDIEVTQTLWVEAGVRVYERGIFLELHPAAFASHLRSFLESEAPAALYEQARDTLGMRQMRDEWGILDDYLRWLAIAQAANRKRLEAAPEGYTVGADTLTSRVGEDKLLERLNLARRLKKEGRKNVRQRLEVALRFCEEVGSLRGWNRTKQRYDLELPHPESYEQDEDQLLLLADPEQA